MLVFNIRSGTMNQPHYRPEDQFKEASNAMRLRQLHQDRDINGLLELALMLNHEAAFNYSRMIYFMNEAMAKPAEVTSWHEKMAAEFTERLSDH